MAVGATSTVYVYFGSAGGLVATPATLPIGANAQGVLITAAGDVNRDGYTDIIVGTRSDRAYLFWGPRLDRGRCPTC